MPSKRTGAVSLKIGRTTLSTASSTFFVFLSSRLERGGDLTDRFGDGGVEQHDRERDRLRRADGAELELVARERERRRAIAVGVVLLDLGQPRDAELDHRLLGVRRDVLPAAISSMTRVSICAHEDRDDRRRRFVGAEPMLVARGADAGAEQARVLVHRLEHGGEEDEEADVLVRRLARLEQVVAVELRVVGGDRHRPVAVLAGSVDAGERLLVQQRLQAVAQRDAAQRRHDELVVIDGDVGLLEARRHLELARRNFVMPRDDRHAELVQLVLDFGDARLDALRDAAEVVILELLAARRRRAEQRAARHDEIRPHREVGAVDEEVLLLGSERRVDAIARPCRRAARAARSPSPRARRSCGAAASSRRALRRCSR